MPHYRFTLESESEIQLVNVNDSQGLVHARQVVRKHFPFKDWRIINIAQQERRFD